MELKDLIALADLIIAGEADPEKASQQIVNYSGAFELWSEGQLDLFENHVSPEANVREDIEMLLAKHGQVIEKAQALLGKTASELKSLRARGKGVIKYLDHMPKRVSTIRGQKG